VRVLFLNQCFYPDVVSTGQHLTDLAVALAEHDHQVTVMASNRGYDDPQVRFAKRECWKGIEIVRLPSFAFGKTARWRRAFNFASLLIIYLLRLAITPRQDVVVAMTSPPLIAFAATLFVQVKGGRLIHWIMDMNPDEAVAAGWLRERSLATRTLDGLQHFALRKADTVVALDRFAYKRLVEKGIDPGKLETISPWSHYDAVNYDDAARKAFRARHDLTDKFVVMHSGNHSPCHPLNTLLEAAERLRAMPEIVFCFIGGGSEFGKVRQFALSRKLKNVVCLPYQPREQLSASLSAGDLHVVVMGDRFVGIVHPCKIYNVLRIGSPFLYIGPAESHVTDIMAAINSNRKACTSAHGEVDEVAQQITNAARQGLRRSERKMVAAADCFSTNQLAKMVQVVEASNSTPASEKLLVAAGIRSERDQPVA